MSTKQSQAARSKLQVAALQKHGTAHTSGTKGERMEADKAFNSSALKQASEQAQKDAEPFRRALSASDFHLRRDSDKVAREKEQATTK